MILLFEEIYAKVSANYTSNNFSAVTSKIHIFAMSVKADLQKKTVGK